MDLSSHTRGTHLPSSSIRLVVRKENSRLEKYLICENPQCRFVISLRENNRFVQRSELILSACPECNSRWSGHCPFCFQTLEVVWQNKYPCCSHCAQPLRADGQSLREGVAD
jgi:hypothetical protein